MYTHMYTHIHTYTHTHTHKTNTTNTHTGVTSLSRADVKGDIRSVDAMTVTQVHLRLR